MKARRVHAVIAAGVENPQLIDRWKQSPELLRDEGIDPDSLDLDALRKFSGLSVKVRHNGVRGDLPLSFRLLSVVGLEIAIFASYALHCAATGRVFAPTPRERAHDLVLFLEQWLDFTRRDHTLLWDIIRHERALSRLAKFSSSPVADIAALVTRPTAGSIPAVCGEIVLHEMRCDPLALAAALRESTPPLDTVPLDTTYQCYWRAADTGGIRMLRLDEFGYYALSGIDGEQSVADLCKQLLGKRRPPPEFLRLFAQLADVGVLYFRSSAGQAAQ